MNSNDTIKFYPYKGNKYSLILLTPLMIVGMIIEIFLVISDGDFLSIVIIGMIIVSFGWILLKLYLDNKTIVIFNEKGVFLNCEVRKIDVHMSWSVIMYCYYCFNWHNNRYIVFSEKSFNLKEVKRIVNRPINESVKKMYANDYLIFPFEVFEKELEEKIKDIISKNALEIFEIT